MHSSQLKYMLIGGGALLVALLIAGVSMGSVLETTLIAVPVFMLMTMGHGHSGNGGCGGHDTRAPRRHHDVPAPVPVETKPRR